MQYDGSIVVYRATSIANGFLSLAEQSGKQLTQIEIQKLVYFAHGWNLCLFDSPLIGEQFEAWKYGPVARGLHAVAKNYGSDPITQKVVDWDIKHDGFTYTVRHIGRVFHLSGERPSALNLWQTSRQLTQ